MDDQAKPKTNRNLVRLRRQLKAHGITQRRVAAEAGVSSIHVCNVLAGRHVSRKVVDTAKRLLAEAPAQQAPERVPAAG